VIDGPRQAEMPAAASSAAPPHLRSAAELGLGGGHGLAALAALMLKTLAALTTLANLAKQTKWAASGRE